METKVEITKKHIRNGLRCAYNRCALALAINDKIGSEFYSTVGLNDFHIRKGAQILFKSKRDEKIHEFVNKFDNFEAKPTTIVLEIPPEFLR